METLEIVEIDKDMWITELPNDADILENVKGNRVVEEIDDTKNEEES